MINASYSKQLVLGQRKWGTDSHVLHNLSNCITQILYLICQILRVMLRFPTGLQLCQIVHVVCVVLQGLQLCWMGVQAACSVSWSLRLPRFMLTRWGADHGCAQDPAVWCHPRDG